MCGIVGYIGPREAAPILLEGLARLEYRGYDSAGIALVTAQGDLFVEKRAGKLAVLRTALADDTPSAAMGLAHTR
ncbi:MAG TPA: glutamine--fructose-6-phosphate aminotransferase, partial [Candidatus Dormibacteraeota bacterium]|nr:glutamine--fructose-6-phosphate aminotransferase [Candidatus Dormibacteraeota bacterium]